MTEAPEEQAWPEGLEQKLEGWEQEDTKHWAKWRTRAKESYGFVNTDQWTSDERSDAEEAGRLITTINRIGPMINAVAGAEIIDRQQVQYVPRTTGDAAVNEILTMGAEWIRDQTTADREESDAFRDVLICGLGYTETIMSYDELPEGQVIIQRIDPLEVTPDCAARKANLLDARRLSRKRKIGKDEFEQEYPDATPANDNKPGGGRASGGSRRKAYRPDGVDDEDLPNDDQVVLTEWQWFEFVKVHVVADPEGQGYVELTPEQFTEGLEAGAFTEDDTVKQRRKVYYRAVKCGSQILEYGKLPDGEFTIKSITGERNRNKGWFDGIVEAMKDPQRFANIFFSMLHHIIRTNAKGGIMAELGAFVDPKKAQDSWAASDEITWLANGGMAKVKPKDAPQIPVQITQLLQIAITGIRDSSGINEELLGLVGRDQAGVLEHQRKQAAYAILAHYYDSLRFYRKAQGTLLLKYMQKYLPEGYLVRIVGEDGDPKYVPLAKQPDTIKFDVIVDEAPAGPNQKDKVWSMMSNMESVVSQAGPEVWAELIEYSPLPDKVNKSLKQIFVKEAQPSPPDPAAMMQAQTEAQKDQATAAKDAATAEHTEIETALLARQLAMPPPILFQAGA